MTLFMKSMMSLILILCSMNAWSDVVTDHAGLRRCVLSLERTNWMLIGAFVSRSMPDVIIFRHRHQGQYGYFVLESKKTTFFPMQEASPESNFSVRLDFPRLIGHDSIYVSQNFGSKDSPGQAIEEGSPSSFADEHVSKDSERISLSSEDAASEIRAFLLWRIKVLTKIAIDWRADKDPILPHRAGLIDIAIDQCSTIKDPKLRASLDQVLLKLK